MSLNRCDFMGNLGGDVELKYLPDGRAVGQFSIACGEKWKDKTTGEIKEKTEWIRCVAFARRAEVIAEYFKKGSQIFVTGKMQTRKWEKDGVTHYTTEIVVNDFQFCNGGAIGQQAQNQQSRQSSNSQANKHQQEQYHEKPLPDNYDEFDDIPF